MSDGGITWERPFWGQDEGTTFVAGPIQAVGKLLLYNRDQVWGVPDDRLTIVRVRSNGLFKTCYLHGAVRAAEDQSAAPGRRAQRLQQ